jgi:hypothetical protein
MNTTRENHNLRLLSPVYRKDTNKVKLSAANTWEHEEIKTLICHELLKKKHKFVTEAIFEDHKGRADVFDITTGYVYEVLYSEKPADFEIKKGYYPEEINEIIMINSGWEEEFIRNLIRKF